MHEDRCTLRNVPRFRALALRRSESFSKKGRIKEAEKLLGKVRHSAICKAFKADRRENSSV